MPKNLFQTCDSLKFPLTTITLVKFTFARFTFYLDNFSLANFSLAIFSSAIPSAIRIFNTSYVLDYNWISFHDNQL